MFSQSCSKELDELRAKALSVAEDVSAACVVGQQASQSLQKRATQQQDALFSCYQSHVNACTSVEDTLASAVDALFKTPTGQSEFGDALSKLESVAAAPVLWPSLAKFNAESLRFAGELSSKLAEHKQFVEVAQGEVSAAVVGVTTAFDTCHSSLQRHLQDHQAVAARINADLDSGLTSAANEHKGTIQSQREVISGLQAAVSRLFDAQAFATSSITSDLKDKFKTILRRQHALEEARLKQLESKLTVRDSVQHNISRSPMDLLNLIAGEDWRTARRSGITP